MGFRGKVEGYSEVIFGGGDVDGSGSEIEGEGWDEGMRGRGLLGRYRFSVGRGGCWVG